MGNECADALAKRGAKLVELDMNAVEKIKWADRVSILIRDRLLFIQRHVITQQPGDGREEEEKKRKKAHDTRAKRLRRKGDDWDCREEVVENEVRQGQSRRRLRRKTREESVHWWPCPDALQQLHAANEEGDDLAESPTVAEATSAMLRRDSKVMLDRWRMKADATHKLCGFEKVVLCIRCGTVGSENGRLGALAKCCHH